MFGITNQVSCFGVLKNTNPPSCSFPLEGKLPKQAIIDEHIITDIFVPCNFFFSLFSFTFGLEITCCDAQKLMVREPGGAGGGIWGSSTWTLARISRILFFSQEAPSVYCDSS